MEKEEQVYDFENFTRLTCELIKKENESNKKYELVGDDTIEIQGTRLYRIRALRSFGDVKAGDLGGYIEHEGNLSHEGNCWVYDNAKVYGRSKVYDNAKVCDRVLIVGLVEIYITTPLFVTM